MPTMKRALIAGGAFVAVLVLVVLVVLVVLAAGRRAFERDVPPVVATTPAIDPPTATAVEEAAAEETHRGFLYGRVTTLVGAVYEGRLRWGGDEEAFWSDYFNGFKDGNPWAAHVPVERLPTERRSFEVFGIEIARRERQVDLGRYFMARFGDVARIEARGVDDVRVTLKSGTVFDLDRLEAGDFDDGVRVWDRGRGVVDLDSRLIHTIELLPTARLSRPPRSPPGGPDAAPGRLHGTVRARQGEFTGFLQWDREECVGSDELDGRTDDGELSLRFDGIRSIARRSRDSSLVTLSDGSEIVLSGSREVGDGNRGVYVDDRRYGRVLISWDAFERVEFSAAGGGSGPAYDDFPPGRALTGSVTTRDGRRLAGRLVYDLDESETTETLDAPSQGVDYTVPFGLIASIVVPGGEERASVTLLSGEELRLEATGDLGPGNAGMLIFDDVGRPPEYVPWTDVEQVDFEGPWRRRPGLPPSPVRSGNEAGGRSSLRPVIARDDRAAPLRDVVVPRPRQDLRHRAAGRRAPARLRRRGRDAGGGGTPLRGLRRALVGQEARGRPRRLGSRRGGPGLRPGGGVVEAQGAQEPGRGEKLNRPYRRRRPGWLELAGHLRHARARPGPRTGVPARRG
ncbi:MAG TPA: hypothetical protein VGG06_32035 [Thermoanaerobaculia bacterium]